MLQWTCHQQHFHHFSAYQEYSDCEIVAIEAKYDFKPYGWGFQKDSPFLVLAKKNMSST